MFIFANVNKLIVILLFPIIIFNASICEVLKTPQLVFHYLQHHEIDSKITFLTFLEMHYLGNDLNDNDEDEDMKLPFKKIDGHHSISIAVPSEVIVLLNFIPTPISDSIQSEYTFLHSNPSPGSLFRPPMLMV
ncbi:hypothetical protein [Pedobacter sp. R20-19]|uniref:hypothetical protein n=1 Tax=Pedobacter sp. R20-19 TaxID=1270196 RepID=UPI00068E1ABD|nr:hypothetical protein [Pedobacter sp. R20-19]